jgi:hypothetical protein
MTPSRLVVLILFAISTAAFAAAQNYLGDAQPNGSGFVLTFNGDLRGKYITALATRWVNGVGSDLFDTAELSKAFLVQ